MAKNQRHTTIASYNYLNEVSAIPKDVRNRYLENLLKRKGAENQKNTRLLKTIYAYIESEKISEWKSDDICIALDMNRFSFYKHTSRLLRGLRAYYFDWKAKAKVLEQTYTGLIVAEPNLEATIKRRMAKARLMWDTGMRKEALRTYRDLSLILRNCNFNNEEKLMYLFEIHEYYAQHYSVLRKKQQVQFHIKQLKEILRRIRTLKSNISDETFALLEIRLSHRIYFLSLIKWHSNTSSKIKNNALKKIYRLAKIFNYNEYLFRVLYSWAANEINKENLKGAKQYCIDGYNLAVKVKNEKVKWAFASFLYYLKTKYIVADIKLNNDRITEYYHRIRKSAPLDHWTGSLENAIVLSYYPEKRSEILEIFHNLINTSILKGDITFAVYSKFKLKEETFNNDLFSYFKENSTDKDIIEIDKINKKHLESIEKTCFNTLCYHKELNNQSFIWDVNKLQLIAKFFDEESFDFESAMLIVGKMEWLRKEKKNMEKISEVKTFELLKIGLKMIDRNSNEKSVLDKFEFKLMKTIDNIKRNPGQLSIMVYAIVSSLSRRLRSKSITAFAAEFYRWLEASHPEILAPVHKEIENKRSKMKVAGDNPTKQPPKINY